MHFNFISFQKIVSKVIVHLFSYLSHQLAIGCAHAVHRCIESCFPVVDGHREILAQLRNALEACVLKLGSFRRELEQVNTGGFVEFS